MGPAIHPSQAVAWGSARIPAPTTAHPICKAQVVTVPEISGMAEIGMKSDNCMK